MRAGTKAILAAALVAVGCSAGFGLRAATEPKTNWLGYPVYATDYKGIDPGFYGGNPPPTQWTDTSIEIGLRDDGAVVWRKKSK